jgi:hypothetical protein
LSWWELSLYVHRFEVILNREQDHEVEEWARFRIQWANFNNAHFKKKVKPKDLVKLPFDKDEDKRTVPMTDKEMKQMFGAKFKKLNGN